MSIELSTLSPSGLSGMNATNGSLHLAFFLTSLIIKPTCTALLPVYYPVQLPIFPDPGFYSPLQVALPCRALNLSLTYWATP